MGHIFGAARIDGRTLVRLPQVLCAGCGGWFVPAGAVGSGARVRCTLCSQVVVLTGELRRTKRRVPRSRRTPDEGPPAGLEERARRARHVIAVCLSILLVWLLAGAAAESLAPLMARLRSPVQVDLRSPLETELESPR